MNAAAIRPKILLGSRIQGIMKNRKPAVVT